MEEPILIYQSSSQYADSEAERPFTEDLPELELANPVLRKSDSNSAVKGEQFIEDSSPQFANYRVNDNAEDDQNIVMKFTNGQGAYPDSSDTEILETAPEKPELKIHETYHPCKFVYQPVRS